VECGSSSVPGTAYDILTDGNRFVMVRRAAERGAQEIPLVQNWFEELEARSPTNDGALRWFRSRTAQATKTRPSQHPVPKRQDCIVACFEEIILELAVRLGDARQNQNEVVESPLVLIASIHSR
jgi:hypothetical protein